MSPDIKQTSEFEAAPQGTPEQVPDFSLGKVETAALTAVTAYAALKGHLPGHNSEAAAHAHQAIDGAAIALGGLSQKINEFRLNRTERKIDKKESQIEDDITIGGEVASAIYYGRDVKDPSYEPVTGREIDISRRTDKRKSKIIDAEIEVERLQNLWGGREEGIVNDPVMRPKTEDGEDAIARHTTRFGLGAKAAEKERIEKPSIFNKWGEGRESFYRLKRTVPDLGTEDFAARIAGERLTPEERRESWKAHNKVMRLEAKIDRQRRKIFRDIEGRSPFTRRQEARLDSLYEKRDRLLDKL
jgi:hypothetical protein